MLTTITSRDAHLPRQRLNATKIESRTGNACVYLWTEEENGKTTYLSKGFAGKSSRPKFYYYFSYAEKRDENAKKFLELWDANAKAKATALAKSKAEKSAMDCRIDLPIGTVMVSSWGWEQTNVDFFKVIAHISRTKFVVRPICSKVESRVSRMAAMVIPDPGSEHGEPMTVRLSAPDRFVRPDLTSKQWATKYCGSPAYKSWQS